MANSIFKFSEVKIEMNVLKQKFKGILASLAAIGFSACSQVQDEDLARISIDSQADAWQELSDKDFAQVNSSEDT